MSITVSLGGDDYEIPSVGSSADWGDALNAYLIALAAAVDAAAAAKSPVAFFFGDSHLDNATRFMSPGYNAGAIEAQDIFVIAPCAGHLTDLQVQMIDAMSAAGGATLTFTVRKCTPANPPVPADTALVVAFTAAGQGGTYAHGLSTGSIAVAKGDLISIKVLDTSYGSATAKFVAQVVLTPS